jgi:hypothetical protein
MSRRGLARIVRAKVRIDRQTLIVMGEPIRCETVEGAGVTIVG